MNVYDEHTAVLSKSPGKDLLQQLGEESMEGLQHSHHRIRLDDGNTDHSFETHSKNGNLVDKISQQIMKDEIDLVVIGNKGCSEVKAIFFGSNTLKLIDGIKQCAILTVPKEIDFKPPMEIAFITDFAQVYDAGMLHPLVVVARQYGSNIRIMHVNEEKVLTRTQEINKNILLEYLAPFNSSVHWVPHYKTKAGVIRDFLAELNIDLLAMINYKHGLLEGILREPVIKRVAYDQDIPFLIIPGTN
tara:strand:- start:1104 stop:1838 length:735 start_codon:yes stop_codon:yes gene_type:complete